MDQGRRRQDWVDRLDFDGRFALYRVTRRLLQPWLRARKIAYLRGDEDLSDPSEQHLRRFQQQLDELIAEAQGLGAQAALILLPAPADLDPAPLPETILEYRAVLRDAAQRHQLPLLDGPAWFRDRGAVLGHFLDQVHPSAQGHALLGEACASLLRGER